MNNVLIFLLKINAVLQKGMVFFLFLLQNMLMLNALSAFDLCLWDVKVSGGHICIFLSK